MVLFGCMSELPSRLQINTEIVQRTNQFTFKWICLVPLCAGLWVSCLRLYWYLRNNIQRTNSDGCYNTTLLADFSAWPVHRHCFLFLLNNFRAREKELALEVNKSPYARSTISREKIEGLWKGWLPLFIEFFLTTPVLQASLSNWSFYNKLLRAVHCQCPEKAKLAPSYRKPISLYSNLRYFNTPY